ncbi:MAG: hypothetical protein H6814_08985 [Phycisphaeraceae bacterium]|nr:hypothetical protein [Phycisphaeraceae bacterium]
MRLLPRGDISPSYDIYAEPAQSTVDRWQHQRQVTASNKLRLPAVLAAQRIGISDARCSDLAEQLCEAKRQQLNLPPYVEDEPRNALQARIERLEDRLHGERLSLWKDLSSLLVSSRDAAVDAARVAFLKEFLRQTASPGDGR